MHSHKKFENGCHLNSVQTFSLVHMKRNIQNIVYLHQYLLQCNSLH